MQKCKLSPFLNYDPKNIIGKKEFKDKFKSIVRELIDLEDEFYQKVSSHVDEINRYTFPTDPLLKLETQDLIEKYKLFDKEYKDNLWSKTKGISILDFLIDINKKEGSHHSFIHFCIKRESFISWLEAPTLVITLDNTYRYDDLRCSCDQAELKINLTKHEIELAADYCYNWMKHKYYAYGG